MKLILAILAFSSTTIFGQNISSANRIESLLDSIAINQMKDFEIPGLSIGFIMNNEVVYAKGFGVQSLESKIPVTDNSLFHMASVSKTFVATAVLQLVEQDRISLDSLLTLYLPYFKMDDPRFKKITIRHILSHSSGIPDVKDYEWDKPQYDDEASERYVRSFAQVKLKFNPGEKFNYSNAGYDILADVISKVSGMTFEEYMNHYILQPIGMKHSTFLKVDVPEQFATDPHVLGDNLEMTVSKIYPYNRIHAPSSTLHSNIHDMLLWSKMYLHKGMIDDNQIIQESTYDLLITPQISKSEYSTMCLGWHKSSIGGQIMYSHTGGDVGYNSFFAFIPEKEIAVFVMGNNRLFWGGNPAYILLNKLLVDREVDNWILPIHYKLRSVLIEDGIDKFKELYFYHQKNNPNRYQFGRNHVDELGYWLIDRKNYTKAIDVMSFNVELHPENERCFDSLGDAFRASGDDEKAIIWYKKALMIKPDKDNTKKKLEALIIKK